jgi:transposase
LAVATPSNTKIRFRLSARIFIIPRMAESSLAQLPDDIDALKALISARDVALVERDKKLAERDKKITILEEYVRLLKSQRFGKSSERFVSDLQESLFNEAEQLDDEEPAEVEAGDVAEVDSASTAPDSNDTEQKARPGRRKLPAHLPRVKVIHKLPQGERQCPCGCQMEVFDEAISEQLCIIPADLYVIQHCRQKYRCTACEDKAPVTAPMPAQPFPKSNASPELMANVVVSKFLDGLPFYRQEQIWKRVDIDLPRATLARWSIEAGNLAQPLINLLREHQWASNVMHIDETPVQVLKEPDKPPEGNKYFWVTASGPPNKPIYLFHYDPSRGSAVADALLEGFRGTVISDDWSVYARVCEKRQLTHIACNDHARRKFDEALKAEPKNKSGKMSKAAMALNYYQKLYAIERKIQDKSPEERQRIRQTEGMPLWDQFIKWMGTHIHKTTPESKFGKALNYAYKLREKLRFYSETGHLPMSNQVAENAIRPFAIARKNFLFYDTPKGASASANLYSLIMTAKSHGLDPFYYLAHVFKHQPRAKTVEDVEKLLPWNVDIEQLKQSFGAVNRVLC